MTAYQFGTGTLIAKRTDVSNSTPYMFGVLQDVSVDFDQKLESLVGQNKVAVALGDGELKITGKAKFARIQQAFFNNMLLNSSLTTSGLQLTTGGEQQSIPGTSTYTITINNAAKTPLEDFGVFYASSGIQLTPVASAPTQGQYTFNASTGVYTFAAADAGLSVYLYYSYTATSAQNSVLYANPLMGSTPQFELIFQNNSTVNGVTKPVLIKLNACKSSKLNLAFSNQKFVIPEFDFQAMADASGNVFTINTAE